MKRALFFLLCLMMLFLLSSCAMAADPLIRAQATPVPGLPMEAHAVTPSQETATQTEVTLFFRYHQSNMLASETRTISVLRNESAELVTIRELLRGPDASHTDLTRLFPHTVSVVNVSPAGDTLFITLNAAFLQDGIPEKWQNDPLWKLEAPLRRKLTLQSLAATVTENFAYPYIQILISEDGYADASTRLDASYFLDGRTGLMERIFRDESCILTLQNTALTILDAWQRHDFDLLYQFTAANPDQGRPVYQAFVDTLKNCAALEEYAASSGHNVGGSSKATVSLKLTHTANGQTAQLEAYPLRLVSEDGIWKVPFAELQRLMLP